MTLYAFHKVARPVTDYLNRLRYSFEFRSNGSVHALFIPDTFVTWPRLVSLIYACGLCYQYNESRIIIF